ncbi:MAG: twin-arginine translocase TatA/TatE family subunit [Anaerolineae bacterium]
MDFLGIGIPELIVIVILALIFVGPRELPQLAQKAGKLLRDLRMMSQGFTTEWEREITAATRLEELEKIKTELAETEKLLKETGREIKAASKVDVLPPATQPADPPTPTNNNDSAPPPTQPTSVPPGTQGASGND